MFYSFTAWSDKKRKQNLVLMIQICGSEVWRSAPACAHVGCGFYRTSACACERVRLVAQAGFCGHGRGRTRAESTESETHVVWILWETTDLHSGLLKKLSASFSLFITGASGWKSPVKERRSSLTEPSADHRIRVKHLTGGTKNLNCMFFVCADDEISKRSSQKTEKKFLREQITGDWRSAMKW